MQQYQEHPGFIRQYDSFFFLMQVVGSAFAAEGRVEPGGGEDWSGTARVAAIDRPGDDRIRLVSSSSAGQDGGVEANSKGVPFLTADYGKARSQTKSFRAK